MPEVPSHKLVPHPYHRARAAADEAQPAHDINHPAPPWAEIQLTTNFTFLTGASHPEEFVERAVQLGYRGLAITDTHTLAGIVRMHVAARDANLPLAVGCRLILDTGLDAANDADHPTPPLRVLVYPTTRDAYGQLCQLLTRGKLRASKGQCHLTLHDLLEHHHDLLAVVIPPAVIDTAQLELLAGLRDTFTDDRLSLAASCPFGPDDAAYLQRLAHLADHVGIPLAATNDVHYHSPVRKPLHDVLACIREGVTLDEAGYLLRPNAEQYLKPPDEMHRLFRDHPHAIARSLEIIERASAFSLDELRYEYPHETCPPGRTPMAHLTDLTWQGAAWRYPQGVPDAVRSLIEHELRLIDELNYPHYFLTVHDIVRFARERGILCQGRGAAANSAVCFCLGITEVDPSRIQILFERFISKERNEPPDIDIDFEHERREEVIQYLYARYGRHRAALTAEVITYRTRSAIRDVGKALGLSLDAVDRLAKHHAWFDPTVPRPDDLRELGFNPDDPLLVRLRFLVGQILGFPRHLSQHVGGFVLTHRPLSETVPIEPAAMPGRTVIEWDKDDIDALGMLKVDVLGLGMLTCVRKCFELIERHGGERYTMESVPAEDPAVYEMISQADTVGVFQIESRAQMSMLPRLQPRKFYDLVIEVAIVRPGPIQGGMVHPYLRRRMGEEPVEYPSEAVRHVLERTLGVPLFQEQAMALAVKAAGFTPGEADALRRAMAAWKRKGDLIFRFGQRLIDGMIQRGYSAEFAHRCFEQIKGFSEYGFPESHAASFALIVYVSAWLKCHHPAAFAAALINSQPMGFYAPAQIVRDAQAHGVTVRPIDVNHSAWDCTLEPGEASTSIHDPRVPRASARASTAASKPPSVVAGATDEARPEGRGTPLALTGDDNRALALRLGMRLVKGLAVAAAERIVDAVARHGPFDTIEALWRASGVPVAALRRLAAADAFRSMGLDRQQALWQVRRLRDEPMPLFDQLTARPDPPDRRPRLPDLPEAHRVMHDYHTTGLSLTAHPMRFFRPRLDEMDVHPCAALADRAATPDGMKIAVAGLVLVRQRPSTAAGTVFMTLEDETGIANLILRPTVFTRYRHAAGFSRIALAHGTVERDTTGRVVHVLVHHLTSLDRPDRSLALRQRNFH